MWKLFAKGIENHVIPTDYCLDGYYILNVTLEAGVTVQFAALTHFISVCIW